MNQWLTRQDNLKWMGKIFLNLPFVFLLIGVTANTLLFASWSWDPLYDLLFLRVGRVVFSGVHVASIASVFISSYYLIIRNQKSRAWFFISATFATASVHEFALYIDDLVLVHQQSGLSLLYFVWLSGFLVIALVFGNRYFRIILLIQFGFCLGWIFFGWGIGVQGTLDPKTMLPVNVNNLLDNFWETVGWMIPSSLWVIPQEVLQ